jgi:hypothetical protein
MPNSTTGSIHSEGPDSRDPFRDSSDTAGSITLGDLANDPDAHEMTTGPSPTASDRLPDGPLSKDALIQELQAALLACGQESADALSAKQAAEFDKRAALLAKQAAVTNRNWAYGLSALATTTTIIMSGVSIYAAKHRPDCPGSVPAVISSTVTVTPISATGVRYAMQMEDAEPTSWQGFLPASASVTDLVEGDQPHLDIGPASATTFEIKYRTASADSGASITVTPTMHPASL